MSERNVSSNPEAGAALLILVAILAVIAALAVGTRHFSGSTQRLAQTENAQMEVVRFEDAVAAFWEANSRLPCPADVTANDGVALPNDGTACTAPFQRQVIPWKTLGLPASVARDSWGNYFAYHVYAPLVLTGAKTGAASITTAITVKETAASGSNITQAAWFVVNSYGKNGKGAYTGNRVQIAVSTNADEAENTDSDDTYVKGGTPGGSFDDILTYWLP
ncbi:MAG: hypothetical protein HQL44_03290 [Alphaproteobacteria bacterium]|nr:hypothetical protein [Alphaproteobacteria bacterium]